MLFYTSLTSSYIPKARVMAKTLKHHNPDAELWLLLSDKLPEDFDLAQEPFDGIFYSDEIILNCNMSVPYWFFLHDVMELCASVKAWGALKLFEMTGADKIVFLDPDLAIFESFHDVETDLDKYDIIITPHRVSPEPRFDEYYYGDHQFYTRGVFNLGFFAVKNSEQGINFLKWWHKNLETLGYVDDSNGLFADQKLVDLAPVLFSNLHISRDERYNISWWNITQREISGTPQKLLVNGKPACFYHFSQYESGLHKQIIEQYCNDNSALWELYNWYSKLQDECGYPDYKNIPCAYTMYDNGERITKVAREQCRKRADIVRRFGQTNPFLTATEDSLYHYFTEYCPEYLIGYNSETGKSNSVEFLQQLVQNKDGHISLLLQSERDLNSELNNKSAHIEQLLQSERDLQQELNSKQDHIEQLLKSERDLQAELALLNRQLHEEVHQHRLAEEANDRANKFIFNLQNSRRWRLASKIASFARKLIPVDSRRAMLCRALVTLVRHPIIILKCIGPITKSIITGNSHWMADQMNRHLHPDWYVEPIYFGADEEGNENFIKPDIIEPTVIEKTAEDYPVLAVPQWKDPQVSIIIPVYNQFDYTYHCVESILKNSGSITYEILIADDCSSDLTEDITKIITGVRHIRNETNLRFLLNCNSAAKSAIGKYVLFLNNDTQVMDNWLEPLVTLIESSDDIGMVGSKLIYPDGRLQEAGGIVWKDASAWNWGNRQNPELPQFNYVKDADYISGASIMLSSALWKKIGGFDEAFTPAYCEDSDLAFTVRSLGYRVVYQPLSTVVHFEGMSNGIDTSTGQKQYQVINREKLYEKWKHVLRNHAEGGTDLFHAKDHSFHKKAVLFVDHYVPTFDKDAGSRTVFQYIKLFTERGYNVKFIGDNFARMEPYTTVLQQMGVEVLYGPEYGVNDGWKNWIRENGQCLDYVFLNRPHIAPRYIDFLREYSDARIIYYGHDLTFLRLQRESQITGNAELLEEAQKWQKEELTLMRKADMSYYPSYVEVDAIHEIDPDIKVKAIPAYLFEDVSWQEYDMNLRKDIMFIGGFSHRPNVDAAKWMAEEILPEILKSLPDIKIHVLGSNVPPEVQELESQNFLIEGFVSDQELENFYKYSRMSLVPLRYGAGIKGKVVEALRFGTPVVTTSVGAEGIPGIENFAIIEDDAVKIAHRIIDLYNNADKLTQMSSASVEYIKNNFSYQNAVSIIGPEFDMT